MSKAFLFLPHRFFGTPSQDGLAPCTNTDTPGRSVHADRFPFPVPPGFNSVCALPQNICCIPLLPAPLSTVTEHTTDTASSVKALGRRKRLSCVKRSRALTKKFEAYADPGSGGVRDEANNTYWTTWTLPNIALPDGGQQAKAVYGMAGWFVSHAAKMNSDIIVNCELAVQDEVNAQLLSPLNYLIRTRYLSTVGNALTNAPAGWRSTSGWPLEKPPENAFYPQWGRPCHADHPSSGRDKAGFSDFMIHKSGSKLDNGAIVEVKFFLSVTDNIFRGLFSGDTAERDTGAFNWEDDSISIKLLKQVWGESHFFKSSWGAITNGSLFILFVKTGPQEITLSEVLSWESPHLLQALAGLTFASIDEVHARSHGIDLKSCICPEGDKDADWERAVIPGLPFEAGAGVFRVDLIQPVNPQAAEPAFHGAGRGQRCDVQPPSNAGPSHQGYNASEQNYSQASYQQPPPQAQPNPPPSSTRRRDRRDTVTATNAQLPGTHSRQGQTSAHAGPSQQPQMPGYTGQPYPPAALPPGQYYTPGQGSSQQGLRYPQGHQPGYPSQAPQQGYPPHGSQHGYFPQAPQQPYPHQGPPQGYPPQGYPPQGYPPQGYLPQDPQQGYPQYPPYDQGQGRGGRHQ